MSNRHQQSNPSSSHRSRQSRPDGGRRSPPLSASSSREPSSKRPRHDDLNSPLDLFRNASISSVPTSHHVSPLGRSNARQTEQLGSNLENLLDEYDLGIDEEEKRRRALEQSRRRRQAIIEKHRNLQPTTTADESKEHHISPASAESTSPPKLSSPSNTGSASKGAHSHQAFFLVKSTSNNNAAANLGSRDADQDSEHTSAAELDAYVDRARELARFEQQRQPKLTREPARVTEQKQECDEVEVTDDDDETEMDMFALSDEDQDKLDANKKRTKTILVPKRSNSKAPHVGNTNILPVSGAASTATANLSSNWDDADGYLRTILGETLDERYQIFAVLGKGMFASVVRARDLSAHGREVAIKIIRVQETMYRAGLKEAGILRKLNDSDPDDRKHLVRLQRHFDYKGHLCMVFESLSMNLRDVVRRYGRDVGLNMQAVRAYAHQLFLALSLLSKSSVIHADIKPDNVLVNDSKALLKLCDLGSASYLSEMEITPYLVSRFYRAPEIILGQPYDCSIDVWSTGCTLYELATGKILFPGRTNNHMLLLMQELRGRFTTKQIRKSQFGEQHFDDANAFLSMEPDKNTGQNVVRRVMLQKPSSDLRSRLLPGDAAKQLKADELKTMNQFVDLLERCLELDPAKRIKPKDALEHPFLAHVRKSL